MLSLDTNKEKWNKIDEYEKYYISNKGRIYSLKTEKILKIWFNNNGYIMISLCQNGKSKSFLVHRLIAQAFIKNPKNELCINHIDHNKKNNKIENLEWCNRSYNIQQAIKYGKFTNKHHARGEGCGQSKLKEKDIIKIKKSNKSTYQLAKIFNVNQSTIWRALVGKNWKHLITNP